MVKMEFGIDENKFCLNQALGPTEQHGGGESGVGVVICTVIVLSLHQHSFIVVPVHKCRNCKTDKEIHAHGHSDNFYGLAGLV